MTRLRSVFLSAGIVACTVASAPSLARLGQGSTKKVATVNLTPDTGTVNFGEKVPLQATAKNNAGLVITSTWTWKVRDTTLFRPIPTGNRTDTASIVAKPKVGATYVLSTAGGKTDSSRFAVRDTATAPPPPPPPPPGGCTGVGVTAGASIQAAVNANPAGTTFCLSPGTWLNQSVIPKAGDVFWGAGRGVTILDGQNTVVFAFDLMTGDPAGGAIRGLTITKYNPPYQSGMIRGGDSPTQGGIGWLVRDNEISYATTGGIRLGPRMRVINNIVHHNRAIGIVGTGRGIVVDSNEIAFNNYLKEFSWGGEAGGTKFASTDSLTVRANYSHDNWGPGLWTDINNRYALYENNRVEDNAGPGIYHEISYNAIIRGNTLKRNGFDFAGWIWGGGIQISTSKDVVIENNTLEDNKVGISVVAQVRGSDWATERITVRNNTVIQRAGVPAGAAADIPTDRTVYYAGIKFTGNVYQTRSGNQNSFEWADGCCRSWAQWKAYGNDQTGSLTVIP